MLEEWGLEDAFEEAEEVVAEAGETEELIAGIMTAEEEVAQENDDVTAEAEAPSVFDAVEDNATDDEIAEPLLLDAGNDDEPVEIDDADEEALRILVTDIVRKELQGETGERITRNLRRLIRKEINQALEIRDMD